MFFYLLTVWIELYNLLKMVINDVRDQENNKQHFYLALIDFRTLNASWAWQCQHESTAIGS